MSGIFESFLTAYSCGDPSCFFEVTSDTYSVYDRSCAISKTIYDLMALDDQRIYCGGSERDHSITFTIKKQTMTFDAYGIKSTINKGQKCYWAYPTKWTLYGSNDKINWQPIDSKDENNILDERGVMHIFNLSKSYLFKYVRLDTHSSHDEQYTFGFSRFE